MSREKPEDRIRNMKYKRDIDDIELLEAEFKLKGIVLENLYFSIIDFIFKFLKHRIAHKAWIEYSERLISETSRKLDKYRKDGDRNEEHKAYLIKKLEKGKKSLRRNKGVLYF